MNRPRCACVHPNARECVRRRQPLDTPSTKMPGRRMFDDSECDCSCHDRDEDGFDAWDDEETRAKGPREDYQ